MCYFLYWLIQFPFMLISPQKIRWLFVVKVSASQLMPFLIPNGPHFFSGGYSTRHLARDAHLGLCSRPLFQRALCPTHIPAGLRTELGMARCTQQCIGALQHACRQHTRFYSRFLCSTPVFPSPHGTYQCSDMPRMRERKSFGRHLEQLMFILTTYHHCIDNLSRYSLSPSHSPSQALSAWLSHQRVYLFMEIHSGTPYGETFTC